MKVPVIHLNKISHINSARPFSICVDDDDVHLILSNHLTLADLLHLFYC